MKIPARDRPDTYIKIAIKTCMSCPQAEVIGAPREDAGLIYKCKLLNKTIAQDVHSSRDMPDIPDDCPIVVERSGKKRKSKPLQIED